MADCLGGAAHAFAVGKEQPLAGVVFIQPMEDFTNRSGSVRILADLQVEQNAEQVSLVVIRDAAIGQPVVVVLLQPGVEAGFFRRLSKVRGAPLQFGDFASRMLFTPDGLEQATRLSVASLHAGRFAGAGIDVVADLGCGIGADALAMAALGLGVLAVERDEATAAIFRAALAITAARRATDRLLSVVVRGAVRE